MNLRKILKDIANDIAYDFDNYKNVLDYILEEIRIRKK